MATSEATKSANKKQGNKADKNKQPQPQPQHEPVLLTAQEKQAYDSLSKTSMQKAYELVQLNVSRKSIKDQLKAVEEKMDYFATEQAKVDDSINQMLTKYAFKHERNVVGVDPNTGEVIFEDMTQNQQMMQPMPQPQPQPQPQPESQAVDAEVVE